MSEVVDLSRYRDHYEIAEPTSLRRYGSDSPDITDQQLANVQQGVDAAANYLNTDGYSVNGDYNGYDLKQGLGRNPIALVGRRGLAEFTEGFQRAVAGGTTDRLALEAASLAYGAYGAAKLILPELYVDDDDIRETWMQLANEHTQAHPDISVRKSMHFITVRAAATLAVVSLQDVPSATLKDAIIHAADERALVDDPVVAADFQHRLGVDYLHMLVAGQPDNSNVIPLRSV